MIVSSRTPEGRPHRCPVCGHRIRIEPSTPTYDAPCPRCGSLVWFNRPSRSRIVQHSGHRVGKVAVAAGVFAMLALLVLTARRFGGEVIVLGILALLLFGGKWVAASRRLGNRVT